MTWRATLTFVVVIVGANLLTAHYGLVAWLGLTATAGTWVAGFAFVARDHLHESGGPRWVAPAIVAGALISAAFSPALALASGVAFLFSELADWSVYAPLRKQGRTRAALASNVVGAVVDTFLFLWIAGFPLDGAATQVLVKVGTTTAFVLGVRLALRSQSVRQFTGGGRHA
jgi:uncharacterized PurR-regulated membrane protein YhhQ (DUF165 family)